MDFLEQSAAQLRALKSDLSAKLAARQMRDGQLEQQVRTLGAARAVDATGTAEPPPAGETLLALDTGEVLRLGLVDNRGMLVVGGAFVAQHQEAAVGQAQHVETAEDVAVPDLLALGHELGTGHRIAAGFEVRCQAWMHRRMEIGDFAWVVYVACVAFVACVACVERVAALRCVRHLALRASHCVRRVRRVRRVRERSRGGGCRPASAWVAGCTSATRCSSTMCTLSRGGPSRNAETRS